MRLGDYYMTGWVEDGSPIPYDFVPLRAAYRPTPEYELWFEDLPLDSFSSRAAFEIRELVPALLLEEIDVPWRQRQ